MLLGYHFGLNIGLNRLIIRFFLSLQENIVYCRSIITVAQLQVWKRGFVALLVELSQHELKQIVISYEIIFLYFAIIHLLYQFLEYHLYILAIADHHLKKMVANRLSYLFLCGAPFYLRLCHSARNVGNIQATLFLFQF